MVYVGGHHERNSVGGELGWYDPIAGTSGSLRTPFVTIGYDVSDLKSALGGTKIVYASKNEKLFVLDVASKQIEREIIPIPGIAGPLGKLTEVAPGIMLGAVSNRIYKVDIRNGSVLYTNTLPGLAYGSPYMGAYYQRLVLGPDGYVWMLIDNSIYRINPDDGSMTNLVDTASLNTAQKSLLFKDGELYVYGEANLYRIRGVLKSLPPATALRIIGL
jgi:outer membrane protein assembly factor BamB